MQTETPLVSVVMAVYNGEAFIRPAIESILAQTYPHFELLILNDGSTDKSVEIIESFEDERIALLHNEGNQGLFFTRNRLLDEAKGDYIAILDCDDCSFPTRLEKQLIFLQAHPEIGLVGAGIEIIDSHGKPQKVWSFESNPKKLAAKLLFQNQFAQSSVLYRAELAKLRYCKEYPLAEDYDLWTRIAKQTQVANLAEVLVQYRQHEHNISTQKRSTLAQNVLKIYQNQLHDLEIVATQTELENHQKIGNLLLPSHEQTFFEAAKTWLERLHTQNDKLGVYDKNVFNGLLGDYWSVVLSQNLDLKGSKEAFKTSILSTFLDTSKKQAVQKAFAKRFFPVGNVLRFWKDRRNTPA